MLCPPPPPPPPPPSLSLSLSLPLSLHLSSFPPSLNLPLPPCLPPFLPAPLPPPSLPPSSLLPPSLPPSQMPKGTEVPLMAYPSTSVLDVRRMLSTRTGLPRENIEVSTCSTVYGIPEGRSQPRELWFSIIHVHCGSTGCMVHVCDLHVHVHCVWYIWHTLC